MFKDADADGNGKIEWTEFLDFTRVMRGGERKKKTTKKKTTKKGTTKKKTTKKTTSKLTNEKRREILRMFHNMVSLWVLQTHYKVDYFLSRIQTETASWTVRSLRTTLPTTTSL